MASPTQWTWVWANSRRQQQIGKTACCSPWGCKESDTTEWLNNKVTYSFWKLKIFNNGKIRVVLQTFLHQPFCSFIALMSRACFHMPTKISELVSFFCHLTLSQASFLHLLRGPLCRGSLGRSSPVSSSGGFFGRRPKFPRKQLWYLGGWDGTRPLYFCLLLQAGEQVFFGKLPSSWRRGSVCHPPPAPLPTISGIVEHMLM